MYIAKRHKFGYAEWWIGKFRIDTGYCLNFFNLGIEINKYSFKIGLGFIWLDFDWYGVINKHEDWHDWEDTNWDED